MEALRIDVTAALGSQLTDDILEWLRCDIGTMPVINQLATYEKRTWSTGDWFVNGPVFKTWRNRRQSLLWLHGIRS